MNPTPRRLAAVGLAILLIVGVGYGIISSASQALAPTTVALSGYIGSEKDAFFKDPRVVAALKRGGFTVAGTTAGSRQIAGTDLSKSDFAFPAGVVLMYPDPTIFSKHTLVGLTPNGIRLGDFLTNDPEMRSLATQFGFRTTDTPAFTKFVADHKLAVPASLINVIDPPTYETLEAMISRLEADYSGQGTPAASPSPSPS